MRVLIPEILVTRNILAAVRSLGRAGHQITVAIPSKPNLRWSLFKSRFAENIVFVQSPDNSPEGYIQDLLKLVAGGDFDVLLPFTDNGMSSISYGKEKLSNFVRIPVADYPKFLQAHDKLDAVRLAHRLDVPTPATFHPLSREGLFALKEQLPFPCLVKARQSVGIGEAIRFATNFDELVTGYDEISNQPSTPPINDYTYPIIQEYVPGQIHDAMFMYWHGECKAAATQVRLVSYPISGGTAVVNQTTHNPHLRDMGQRLLDTLDWHGPALVEFRLDPRDGKYKLLEINTKFWGSLALSMVAGINFSRMACELACYDEVEPDFNYRVGVTYRWLFPDELFTLVQQPTFKRLWQFLHFWAPDTHYDWDIRDPLPDLYRAVTAIGTALFARKRILPARQDLNDLAMQRPPEPQSTL
jgi:predicted ATP-grasp superfamily ATP-dependent carboligase